jgi:hypothetical protein
MKKLIISVVFFVCALLAQVLTPTVLANDLDGFKSDVLFLANNPSVEGVLFFVPFGSNPDPSFEKHRVDEASMDFICDNDCSQYNIGANFGTFYKGGNYKRARQHQMNWALEIANLESNNLGSIAGVINDEGIENVIVRIGVGNKSFGFNSAHDYVTFLQQLSGAVHGAPFYAIAGPNEPDIETWSIPGCQPPNQADPAPVRHAFYECAAPQLKEYMDIVIAGAPSNVKLLSPAFNMTSFMFHDDTGLKDDDGNKLIDGIPMAMLRHGANFGGLHAIAGNLYPNNNTMQNYWNDGIAPVIAQLGKPVVITETGPWGDSLKTVHIGYDTSIYDEYDTTEDEFYLSPIRGLVEKDVGMIRRDLVAQGYQAYCAAPRYRANLRVGSKEIIEKFLQLFSSHTLTLDSTQVLDFTNAKTPLWRNVDGKRYQFASIEEFFGFEDTKILNPSDAEIRSGAINSLLSDDQRCTQSIALLKQVQEMCNRLVDPSSCTLRDRPIPDSGFTYQTLYEAVDTLPEPDSDKYQSSCHYWSNEINTSQTQNVIRALETAPLYLDRVYRTAFLIVAIEQIPEQRNKVFNFFLGNNKTADNKEVIVISFKVPDVGTNAGNNMPGDTYLDWADPLTLTRDSLITQDAQENNTTKRLDFVSALQNSAGSAFNQQKSDRIYCNDNGGGSGATTHCNPQTTPLGRAVVDIVNGQARSSELANKMLCDDFDLETSDIINDPAHLNSSPASQTLFSDEFGRQLVSQLLPESAQTTLNSNWKISDNTYPNLGDSKTNIDTYLVYPVGVELGTVEAALSGAFFTQDELKSLNRDDPYQRQGFEMDDTIQNFDGGDDSHSFKDPDDLEEYYDLVNDPNKTTPLYRPKEKTFSGSVSDIVQKPARILGGTLGYWMRTIQLGLHKLVSVPHQYLATCKTTEEFLLGKCGGEDVSPKIIKDTTPILADMGQYCGAETAWITNTSGNYKIKRMGTVIDDVTSPGYFVNSGSPLKIDARAFTVDGATLVTTNNIETMNPGQQIANGRCDGAGAHVKLKYLPDIAHSPGKLNVEGYWDTDGYLLEYSGAVTDNIATNLGFSLNVKPGYYKFFPDKAGCFSSNVVHVNKDGTWTQDNSNSSYFQMTNSTTLGHTHYCGQVVMNSNMPGAGDKQKLAEDVRGCSFKPPYHLELNGACGGLSHDNESNLWETLKRDDSPDEPKPTGKDDNPDETKPVLSIAGLARYQNIFNFSFIQPTGGEYKCDNLFPNVVAEVECGKPYTGNPLGCDVLSQSCAVGVSNCVEKPNHPCTVENLQAKIMAYVEKEVATGRGKPITSKEALGRAQSASKICLKESTGDATRFNQGCVTNETLDYSVGLFQINMLAHDCHETFIDFGTATNPWCILDPSPEATSKRADCVIQLQDPDYNIQKMLELSSGGTNWFPWKHAKDMCEIN